MFSFIVFGFVCLLQTVVICCSKNSTAVIHISVPEHYHVHLPCGDPETSVVVWTDQDQSITVGRWGSYETNEDPKRFLLLPDGSLRLLWLDESDSGEYHCNQQLVAELQVLTGSDFTVSVGRTLLLPCSSFSKSRVRWFLRRGREGRQLILTWFRNGTTKAERDEGRLSFDNDTLQIQDLQPGDSGQYQCSGKVWTRFTVTVVQPEPTGFSRTTDPTQTPPVTETDEAEAKKRKRKEKEERRKRPQKALLIVGVISLGLMILLMAAVGILLSILRCRRKRKKHGAEGRKYGEPGSKPAASRTPDDTELQPWKTSNLHTEVHQSPSLPEETIHYASLGRQNWKERPARTLADPDHHSVIYSSVVTKPAAK